ncbi:hypothetical protein R5W23_002699 [Gemmata sp. JC673]|uniref:RNA polymerase sigma-70 region 4 domain-containing protein n=1 Tax=Gemmata algarum TaxID=2975278 RepID=A0ABU5F1Z4_9BACT|nr:hypothetical protein [Gemmata algarum]MDY3561421.1 hypothetical protein [Gemmata algarum]
MAALLARAKLTTRQRELFTRHVGGGELLGDLAAEQGASRSRVGHVVAGALVKLRAAAG